VFYTFSLILLLSAAVAAQATVDASADASPLLDNQRQAFVRAQQLIGKNQLTDYRAVRNQLDEYPLAIYLDLMELEARLSTVSGDQASEFVQAADQTPLAMRFKDKYLRSTGKRRSWEDFLAVSPDSPNSVELKCYYFRAQNQVGARMLAWEGARELWLHGKSRPKACDPLFEQWIEAGLLDDEVIWQRQLLAFAAHRSSLMSYVARKSTPELTPWSERLLAAYRQPERIDDLELPATESKSSEIYVRAVSRLARRDAGRALDIWLRAQASYEFNAEQRTEVEDTIAWRALLQPPENTAPWLDDYLVQRRDGRLLEKRLRNAIADSDWQGVLKFVEALPAEHADSTTWRYWRAHSLLQQGDVDAATLIYTELAGIRDYYGFLAAEHLQKPYSLNHVPLVLSDSGNEVIGHQAVQRTGELIYHQRPAWAQSEWSFLLPTLEHGQQVALSAFAGERGWYRLAIDAANTAKAWDALELRFPPAFEDTFDYYGQRYGIPETELMAIARRESAFFPRAVSGVGAKGLMQLMPATARSVARSLQQRDLSQELFEVDSNVALGGAYYRQLLDRYHNNRVLSLAAYNAGPHRVTRWLNDEPDKLSVVQWIETIPFRETRAYVQGVLAYNVVFRKLRNQPTQLLTAAEIDLRL
jgi:soluble lytic murein transglycosylase